MDFMVGFGWGGTAQNDPDGAESESFGTEGSTRDGSSLGGWSLQPHEACCREQDSKSELQVVY
jgi:hypothetical protein